VTTRIWFNRERPPPAGDLLAVRSAPSLNLSAGSSPNSTPVSSDNPVPNASTVQSGAQVDRAAPQRQVAREHHRAPLREHDSRESAEHREQELSVTSCRTSPAATRADAARTASSRCRAAPRASERPARLAHAISSTSPTTTASTESGPAKIFRNPE